MIIDFIISDRDLLNESIHKRSWLINYILYYRFYICERMDNTIIWCSLYE